jgi:hypothetical protein
MAEESSVKRRKPNLVEDILDALHVWGGRSEPASQLPITPTPEWNPRRPNYISREDELKPTRKIMFDSGSPEMGTRRKFLGPPRWLEEGTASQSFMDAYQRGNLAGPGGMLINPSAQTQYQSIDRIPHHKTLDGDTLGLDFQSWIVEQERQERAKPVQRKKHTYNPKTRSWSRKSGAQ